MCSGRKVQMLEETFTLFYHSADGKRNCVGVILQEKFVKNVLEVKRMLNRLMSLKTETEGVMINVVNGYATQVGCE